MGYCEESKAYRLFDETNHKIVVSRDVIFIESRYQTNDTQVEKPLHTLESPVSIQLEEETMEEEEVEETFKQESDSELEHSLAEHEQALQRSSYK